MCIGTGTTSSPVQSGLISTAALLSTTALVLVCCKQSGIAALLATISMLVVVALLVMQQERNASEANVAATALTLCMQQAQAQQAQQAQTQTATAVKAQTQSQAVKAQAQAEAVAQAEAEAQAEAQARAQAQQEARARAQAEADADAQAQARLAAFTTPLGTDSPPLRGGGNGNGGVRLMKNSVADVPGNDYRGVETRAGTAAPAYYIPVPPRMEQKCASTKLVLPIIMEGERPYGPRANDVGRDNATSCGGNVQTLPPLPGLALPPPPSPSPTRMDEGNGESVWRLPEAAVDQCSREGSIAAVVSGLPDCCQQQTPMDAIRNQGLYGIKGNLSCDKLKRSAVADFGFVEPLGARNAYLAYDSYDQLHSKDQYLIAVNKPQPE